MENLLLEVGIELDGHDLDRTSCMISSKITQNRLIWLIYLHKIQLTKTLFGPHSPYLRTYQPKRQAAGHGSTNGF